MLTKSFFIFPLLILNQIFSSVFLYWALTVSHLFDYSWHEFKLFPTSASLVLTHTHTLILLAKLSSYHRGHGARDWNSNERCYRFGFEGCIYTVFNTEILSCLKRLMFHSSCVSVHHCWNFTIQWLMSSTSASFTVCIFLCIISACVYVHGPSQQTFSN